MWLSAHRTGRRGEGSSHGAGGTWQPAGGCGWEEVREETGHDGAGRGGAVAAHVEGEAAAVPIAEAAIGEEETEEETGHGGTSRGGVATHVEGEVHVEGKATAWGGMSRARRPVMDAIVDEVRKTIFCFHPKGFLVAFNHQVEPFKKIIKQTVCLTLSKLSFQDRERERARHWCIDTESQAGFVRQLPVSIIAINETS